MNLEGIDKKIGVGLVVIGLLLIILPLFQTYAIFTGFGRPPQLFERPESLTPHENVGSFEFQKQIENAFIKSLPIDLLNSVLNLISWLILMAILMFGGKLIADIGVNLLKT